MSLASRRREIQALRADVYARERQERKGDRGLLANAVRECLGLPDLPTWHDPSGMPPTKEKRR